MSAVAYSLTEDMRPLRPGRRLCRCPALGEALGNWSYRLGFKLRMDVRRYLQGLDSDRSHVDWWQAQRKFMRSGPGVRDELCVRCYEDGWEYAGEVMRRMGDTNSTNFHEPGTGVFNHG